MTPAVALETSASKPDDDPTLAALIDRTARNEKVEAAPVEKPVENEPVVVSPPTADKPALETKQPEPKTSEPAVVATDPAPALETTKLEPPRVGTESGPSAAEPSASDPPPVAVQPVPAELTESHPIPEPKPSGPVQPGDTVAPSDDWGDLLGRLRELARRRAGEPGDAAQAWSIRTRVLDWLAGDGPEPAGETTRVWNSVLATLSTATGSETPDEPTLAYHLGAAVDALESYAPLQITALIFCRKINGFGHFEALDSPSVRPGHALLVYCEMNGLKYEPDKDTFRSRLESKVEIVPSEGGEAVWSEALGTAEDVCRRRRRDYFVNYRIVVPARLAAGSYALRLSQTDLIAGRSVSASVPFSVKP
jgi:hypothetical protein